MYSFIVCDMDVINFIFEGLIFVCYLFNIKMKNKLFYIFILLFFRRRKGRSVSGSRSRLRSFLDFRRRKRLVLKLFCFIEKGIY